MLFYLIFVVLILTINLKQMNRLIFYNSGSGTATQIKAASDVYYKYHDATIKDLSGISTGDIDTYIGTLTDDTYDEIWVCCTTNATAATGILSFQQLGNLRAKMAVGKKGTVVDEGTCQANSTVTEIILAATASDEDDAYNGMFIETTGTTAVVRYISDYVGLTTTATVLTTTTAITTTETYEVYTNDYIYTVGDTNAVSGKTACLLAWDVLFPDVTYPLINTYLGGYQFAMNLGTAQAVGAATITLAANIVAGGRASQTEHETDSFYKGMYVYIYSATTGAAQVGLISTYVGSTRVATVSANWGISLTGTVVYRIVDNLDEALNDKATEIMVKTYMYDIDAIASVELNKRFIDYNNALKLVGTKEADQDLDYLWNDFLYRGKAIFAADALGVV